VAAGRRQIGIGDCPDLPRSPRDSIVSEHLLRVTEEKAIVVVCVLLRVWTPNREDPANNVEKLFVREAGKSGGKGDSVAFGCHDAIIVANRRGRSS
jgi:hypothetical protein